MTPPYAHIPEQVIEAVPRLSDKAVRVAVALGAFANAKGECWPARAALMARSGMRRAYTVRTKIGNYAVYARTSE